MTVLLRTMCAVFGFRALAPTTPLRESLGFIFRFASLLAHDISCILVARSLIPTSLGL